MDINISEANQFIGLHAHPQTVSSNDVSLINGWILKYPYCQTLHFLALQADQQGSETEEYLTKAATFASNREVLFQFTNHIENFESESVVLDEALNAPNEIPEFIEPRNDMGQAFGTDLNYYKVDETKNDATGNFEDAVLIEEETQNAEPVLETETVEEAVAKEDIEEPIAEKEEVQAEELTQETETVEEAVAEEIIEEPVAEQEEVQTEEPILEVETVEETVAEETIEEPVAEKEEVQAEEPIQEIETVEETVGEETIEEPVAEKEEVQAEEPTQETENIEEPIVQNNEPVQAAKPAEKDELIFESPIASDFFAFAKAEKPGPLPVVLASKQPKEEEKTQAKTTEDISQYNDERLPYSFLWWLNKTRKEHASNTQPYLKTNAPVTAKKENPTEQSLNHQIAENIFHLRAADEIAGKNIRNQTVPFDFMRKEFQIIDKFIKEEPQIKPPAANKIDTENKAKKSSEDTNQVVSETLAKIYVEQMLYHKALDVYKKLSLKYPEKSTYFASQIKYLELKVN